MSTERQVVTWGEITQEAVAALGFAFSVRTMRRLAESHPDMPIPKLGHTQQSRRYADAKALRSYLLRHRATLFNYGRQ